MGMMETIRRFLSGKRYDDLDQRQTEAFIDALTFAMVVDGEVAPSESDRLAEALEEFDWRGESPLEVYTEEALDRAERLGDDPERAREYTSEIAERLGGDQLHEEVYFLSAKVACADEQLRDSERVLLSHFVDAFELDDDRLHEMTQMLVREM